MKAKSKNNILLYKYFRESGTASFYQAKAPEYAEGGWLIWAGDRDIIGLFPGEDSRTAIDALEAELGRPFSEDMDMAYYSAEAIVEALQLC